MMVGLVDDFRNFSPVRRSYWRRESHRKKLSYYISACRLNKVGTYYGPLFADFAFDVTA